MGDLDGEAESEVLEQWGGCEGAVYFRQSLTISGRSDGRGYGGEVVLDYSLASGPTYCFSRKQSRIAPAAGLNRSLRQLRSVQASIAYFGPGV